MPSPVSFPRRVVLAFDPARDGFSFRNQYTWTDADLDVLSKRLRAATSVPVALGAGLRRRSYACALEEGPCAERERHIWVPQ